MQTLIQDLRYGLRLGETEGFRPIVLVGTAALLGDVALIATLIPSRRAASIDPMQALRTE